jgi:hypothetical protein
MKKKYINLSNEVKASDFYDIQDPRGMKQTAVEWFVNEIKVARKLCDDQSMEMDIWHTLDILIAKGEQAKEMEKEQMIDAWVDGNDNEPKEVTEDFAEQYYNEQFKNK